VLCVTLVLGYVLTGPIPNQVLISNWFRAKRGRAMGYVYLGAGLGGALAPLLANILIEHFGWRHALEITGMIIPYTLRLRNPLDESRPPPKPRTVAVP